MEIKTLEIRDRATFIAVMAILLEGRIESEKYLLGRAGYPSYSCPYLLLTRLSNLETNYSYGRWENRTMRIAHKFVQDNWDTIENGQVIDVEYILGETNKPKESERLK